MIKERINNILDEINKVTLEIQEVKKHISELKLINESKTKNNYLKFEERISDLKKSEESIKLLMENKFFRYIKHIDFLNEDNIYSSKGFKLIKDLGCITKDFSNENENYYINRIIEPSRKKITYFYEENAISNIIEYSFYNSKTGLPAVPKSINIYYKNNLDELYEPYFRFFNRNNSTSFINRFHFTAKQISKVVFEFDESINENNSYCKLTNVTYDVIEDNNLILKIDNEYKLKTFNISKKTEESIIPLKFYFSEDNINFTEIFFDNNVDDIISLENDGCFFIKIIADNDSIKLKEEKSLQTNELFSKELNSSFGVYDLPATFTNINNVFIKLSTSSYNSFSKDLENLKNLSINDLIDNKDNLYIVKNEYIEYVDNADEKINKLKYLDDISVLANDKNLFKIYVDNVNKKIYCPSFMEKYNFFIEVQYVKEEKRINKEYYTPIIFSISLKG